MQVPGILPSRAALSYNETSVNLSEETEVSAAARPLRVVAIGGGTGLSTLLRGLCSHVVAPGQISVVPGQIGDLAAVVTVTDDGGSSGRLRSLIAHAG